MESTEYINYSKLLQHFHNDEPSLKYLFTVFIKNCDQDIPDLNTAYENTNKDEIKRLAHKLKSSFLSLDLMELHHTAKNIEALILGGEPDYETIKQKINHITDTYQYIRDEIQEYIKQ